MEKGSRNRRKAESENISLYATLQVFHTELISPRITKAWLLNLQVPTIKSIKKIDSYLKGSSV
jgi:hypothetical protein